MECRDTGRPTITPNRAQLLLSTFGYFLFAFALLSVHGDAFAANLVDVRVGEHRGYTRVVLELDSLAGYQVSEPREGDNAVMKVELDARGSARSIETVDAVVKGVQVESSGQGTSIQVLLRKAEVQINEMILLSPPRLVFDIRDPAKVAVIVAPKPPKVAKTPLKPVIVARRAASVPAAPKSEPASVPAPAKPASVVKPAAARPATRSSTSEDNEAKPNSSVATAETPGETAAVANRELAAASTRAASTRAASAQATVAEEEPVLAGVTKAATRLPGHPLPVGGAASGRPNSLSTPPTNDLTASSRTKLAVPPLPSQRSQNGADRPAAPASAKVGGVAKLKEFVSGINKILLAGAGLAVILLLFFVIRRGRGGDDALSPVMAADHLGGDGDDLFGGPGRNAEATEPVPARPSNAAPPPPVAPSAPGGGGGLETRLAQLETTLVQLTQSRETMERQLAAQTEELRVQRAAIARTQRVVRSFGDGEEDQSGATEPVPRAPAS